MAELSAQGKVELELVTKGATAFLELERQARREAHDINDREDKFAVWIVALSAGAIAGISTAPRLAGISRLEAIIVLAPFVLSVLMGIVYRWILKKFDVAEFLASYNKQSSYIAVLSVLLPRIQSDRDISDVKARLKEIHEKRDPKYSALVKKVDLWERLARIFCFAPAAFFIGVFVLAVVASINWPDTSPGSKTPKELPQIRQGKS